ncbi:hypothetical protein BDV95DRAFT_624960 [Massariosphaeria phaeospora]|uniref:SnoaL-like domain-containing protein n=1 Tax=Massariosphaeria phaeospora TaxID=100035 RepID=A0A7C8IK83_9PLEO|nr:hypothetical protein BDV95DRAFT_624960 [Massariosphaeria phaeospora]
MAEYTSTFAGFQRAMEWSLTGPPAESKHMVDTVCTPGFYQVMNGARVGYDEYLKGIEMWRGKVSEYKPVVEQFLRDGDQLAARMTGTIKVDGTETAFESFLFAKIDKESGKMEHLIERSVWGPVGGESEHGTKLKEEFPS